MVEHKAVTLCQTAEFLLCGDVHVREQLTVASVRIRNRIFIPCLQQRGHFEAITSIYAIKNLKNLTYIYHYYSDQKA